MRPFATVGVLRTRVLTWDDVKAWGAVRRRRDGRIYLQFGRLRVYTFDGARFASVEHAQGVLNHVRQLAQQLGKERVLERVRPTESKCSRWLRRWIADFREQVRSGDRAPRTLREYERWADPGGHFSFWYEISIYAIGPLAAKEWLVWLRRRGIEGKTAWNVVAGFSSFVGWLVEMEELPSKPRLIWPKKRGRHPRTISLETQRAILDAIPEPRRGVFLAMALLGLRPGEAVELSSRHLRADGWMTVCEARRDRTVDSGTKPTKSGEPKTLPVPDELADWIARYVPRDQLLRGGHLFLNPHTRRPWSEAALRRQWYEACRQVGVRISLYEGTKHSTATALRRAGVGLDVIQALLGHRDRRSTEVYAQLANEALVEALRTRVRKP